MHLDCPMAARLGYGAAAEAGALASEKRSESEMTAVIPGAVPTLLFLEHCHSPQEAFHFRVFGGVRFGQRLRTHLCCWSGRASGFTLHAGIAVTGQCMGKKERKNSGRELRHIGSTMLTFPNLNLFWVFGTGSMTLNIHVSMMSFGSGGV